MEIKLGEYSTESDSQSILLSGKDGGYWYTDFANPQISRFCGVHMPYFFSDEWDLLKVIHSFNPTNPVTSIEREYNSLKLICDDASVTYEIGNHSLRATSSGKITLPLVVDCRGIYDFDSVGRIFNIYQHEEYLVIEYSKYRDDSLTQLSKLGSGDYKCFVVLRTKGKLDFVKQWREVEYAMEKHRNSSPTSSYVFDALDVTLDSQSIDIAYGLSLEECLSYLNSEDFATTSLSVPVPQLRDLSLREQTAFTFAVYSFDQLQISLQTAEGLYAGYPWFFQFWARDEAISLGALIKLGQTSKAEKILLRELSTLRDDGRIANRHPHSDLGSADGVGWMCRRFIDLIEHESVDFVDFQQLYATLLFATSQLERTYLKEGLIYSYPLETWMDTGEPYDVRDGWRIEIQALHLAQLKLLNIVRERLGIATTSDEADFRSVVRKKLFTDVLHDGLNADGTLDKTIRPNVILAHYIYPELLENHEWEATFDNALGGLWQDWGGISTIEIGHDLYKPTYTGQTNESYHRGDVWYWVNCMSAISLHRVNSEKYEKYVWDIVRSSCTEILEYGAIGSHAEVSDSVELSSHGCVSQLWSSAMFIELFLTLRP